MRRLLPTSLVAGLLIACGPGEPPTDREVVQRAVRESLGNAVRAEVGVRAHAGHPLVMVDGEEFRALTDSAIQERVRRLADVVMASHPAAATLDEITVIFVRFFSSRGGSFCGARGATYAVTAATESTPASLNRTFTEASDLAQCPAGVLRPEERQLDLPDAS